MIAEAFLSDAQLTEPLCNGTGCVLWRGWSPRHGRLIAKVFPRNNRTAGAYGREASVLRSLKHRHVVRYLGVSETADSLAIFTKDCGESLFDYACRGPLPERAVRAAARGMCEALGYCHARRLCHGDVKLENFAISARGRVRLLDFGLAEALPDGGSVAPCGSTFYRAPELICGRPHGTAIDVWALGVAVFALATREFPFPADDEYANVLAVLADEPDLGALAARSAALAEAVKWMLQKDPARRPSAAELLRSPWLAE
jgi:serine/threonine protein kinase